MLVTQHSFLTSVTERFLRDKPKEGKCYTRLPQLQDETYSPSSHTSHLDTAAWRAVSAIWTPADPRPETNSGPTAVRAHSWKNKTEQLTLSRNNRQSIRQELHTSFLLEQKCHKVLREFVWNKDTVYRIFSNRCRNCVNCLKNTNSHCDENWRPGMFALFTPKEYTFCRSLIPRWHQQWKQTLYRSHYSQTSLIRTSNGQNQVSALQRCPYYRGRECMIFGISGTRRTLRNREVSVL